MHELFLYGTMWFWVLTVVTLILAFIFSENENGLGATSVLVVHVLTLQFLSDIHPVTYVYNHPFLSLGWFAGYFVVGTVWATIKWILYLQDEDAKKDEAFHSFREENNLSEIGTFAELTLENRERFDRYLADLDLSRRGIRFRDHVSDYTRWLTFWLFNMIYTALNDFVRRTVRAIVKGVSRNMQACSDRINSKWVD